MILENTLDRDTRATKIIRALVSNGYKVDFLGWNRGHISSRSEKREAGSYNKETLFNYRAPAGYKILLYLPIWWVFVFKHLMTEEFDIVHAIHILSIPPALIAGFFKGKPVIYDILDTYEDSILMPKIVRNIIVIIDKIFMRLSSSVILADKNQIIEVGGIPNKNLLVIYDSPDTLTNINKKYIKNDAFTLFFAGSLNTSKALNLDKVISAIKDIKDIKLIFAGYGDLVDEVLRCSKEMPDKISFIGEINRSEVLERSLCADLLFVLRDPIIPVNKYICGSKILEAMWCGKPILVNKGTSTADIVIEENCGLVIDAKDVKQIENAIIKLKDDPILCSKLGKNAADSYQNKYSWDIMKKRLLDHYYILCNTFIL